MPHSPSTSASPPADTSPSRKRIMDILARADETALETFWNSLQPRPDFSPVRGPETGLVMIRGRMGGGGAPFNLGEATVSRATIRLSSGEIGFGQALGLSGRKAELAAIIDALGQTEALASEVKEFAAQLSSALSDQDDSRRRQTAATRVDFFTMVRGED
jgi:alpha-D-ribose 1-methylphosphonate 5-triphosphate synthase subunit PhnG